MKRLLIATAALALSVNVLADELTPGEYWGAGWGKLKFLGNGKRVAGPYTDTWNKPEPGQVNLWVAPVSGLVFGDWGELSIGRIGELFNITLENGGQTINGDWRVIAPGILNGTELSAGVGKFSFILSEPFSEIPADDSVEVQEAAAISALRRIFGAQTAYYESNGVFAQSPSELVEEDLGNPFSLTEDEYDEMVQSEGYQWLIFLSDQKADYQFDFTVGDPDDNTDTRIIPPDYGVSADIASRELLEFWVGTADPVVKSDDGARYFYINQTGVIRENTRRLGAEELVKFEESSEAESEAESEAHKNDPPK